MSDAPRLLEDTRDLLDAFEDAGVAYIVVGAHALAAHGIPRATGDFDVLVRPDRANATRVLAALRHFGAPVEAHGLEVSDFTRPATVYQMGLPPRRIDVLTSVSGVDFDEAWASRIEAEVDGRRLPVLGRAALLKNKRASGRPKDLLDVAALERSSGAR
ncbi:nucleotidyltransferase family protein [Myxococcota bacterium]|nr:nucleotidyltransferase family protein [Myxococcota bacterium]